MAIPKVLNKEATTIFCELLHRMETVPSPTQGRYLKIQLPGYLPLSISRLSLRIRTGANVGHPYLLSQINEQKGDFMLEPGMTFIIVDHRAQTADPNMIWIYPESYQQDSSSIFRECLTISENRLVNFNPRLSAELSDVANSWMMKIKADGYLDDDRTGIYLTKSLAE